MFKHSYKDETVSLLTRLIKGGYTVSGVEDGCGTGFNQPTIEQAIDVLLSTDEGTIRVARSGFKFNLYLVFGNEPGLIVCNYSWPHKSEGSIELIELDKLTNDHYNEWS
jgi:hypothetical protein